MTDPVSAVPISFALHGRSGDISAIDRSVAVEAPVAIEVDGLAYAVLMATPADLNDLVTGFALGERLADAPTDIVDVDVHEHPGGWIARLTMSPPMRDRVAHRVRHRVSDSACGLCGVETLEQAMRPLPQVAARFAGTPAAVFAALVSIEGRQPLNAASGAVHAAALCDSAGEVLMVREDVGRHNALDKLIGAMARRGIGWNNGFALMTSRCSYELVEKAVIAGCPLLATMSAPTSLALARAACAGMPVVSLARRDSLLLTR